MARFAVGMLFGVVVGVFAGAAAGLHADEDDVALAAEENGVDPIKLQGAINTTGMDPRGYLCMTGEGPCPKPPLPSFSVWDRLAACESNGRWNVNTGNGFFGGIQFDFGTWLRHGGGQYAARADLASRAQQIEIAQRTLAAQGWAAWPWCSRQLGLR